MTVSRSASTGWSTTTRRWAWGGRYSLGAALAAPQRNLELKARDPDPARSLERALALGAEDRGEIVQRDTYFARAARSAQAARADARATRELIQYRRADEAGRARTSDYRLVPVADADALREALDAALARSWWSRSAAGCCSGRACASTSTRSTASAPSSSSRRSDRTGPPAEHEKVERLRAELEIDDDASSPTSYSDLLLDRGRDRLLAAPPRRRCENAYAPHSGFKVGAALRAPTAAPSTPGANVENAAYPQGQCAEASAIGALVAAGEREIAAVAVVAEQMDVCPPCGGCRQRLAEFARPGHARSTSAARGTPRRRPSASCCRCRSSLDP